MAGPLLPVVACSQGCCDSQADAGPLHVASAACGPRWWRLHLQHPQSAVGCSATRFPAGDTLQVIADALAIPLAALLRANPSLRLSSVLLIGHKVHLPPWGPECPKQVRLAAQRPYCPAQKGRCPCGIRKPSPCACARCAGPWKSQEAWSLKCSAEASTQGLLLTAHLPLPLPSRAVP